MKVKFRFGKPDYWNRTEKWQSKAIMNVLGIAILSIIMLFSMAKKDNITGAITFGIFMFLYTAPQIYQYEKWWKKDSRIRAGLEKDE